MTNTLTKLVIFALLGLAAFMLPEAAMAQNAGPLNISLGDDLLSTERMFQLIILLTVLSLAPSILVMVTSFTRIVIVFSFLRSAMGLQNTPPNSVLISLALFLTAFIMAPTLQAAYSDGVRPFLDNEVTEEEAFTRTVSPFKEFMMGQVNERDLSLFIGMLPQEDQDNIFTNADSDDTTIEVNREAIPLQALVPAFMISELKRAFEIGFLIFLPFLVIDLTVAAIIMSMGMMMLPPVMISLPFKIIFFVLVDGWHMLTGSLVQSFY